VRTAFPVAPVAFTIRESLMLPDAENLAQAAAAMVRGR